MSGREAPLYQRGKYRLEWDRKSDGSLRSPYLAIFWYDEAVRRVRSTSTGTSEVEAAIVALDRKYLADRGEASTYCHACGQPLAHANGYLLTDAIADYRLEIGDERQSATSIAARLKHVVDYLAANDLVAASCADACAPLFADRFRAWSRKQPVTWRNGDGAITKSKQRSPATTEESVIQLCAVLNHAANETRSDLRPAYRPLPRKQVSQPRRVRIDAVVLADMLTYAAEPKKRRGALHAFLVGSICTLARPDAVTDISTAAERRQWWPGSPTLDLNPFGRPQTKKFRATVPVLPVLEEWLIATHNLADSEKKDRTGGWLVNYYGRPVQDVDRSWEEMLRQLGLPLDREWRPYLLRHSLATLLRGHGAQKWELQAMMGHRSPGMTEIYAVEEQFPTVVPALTKVLDAIELRAPGVLHRTRTGQPSNVFNIGGEKMSG